MITISTPCCFASYDVSTKKLTSSIISINENTTIISGADAPNVNNDVIFCSDRGSLISKLKAKNVKNQDDSEILEEL